MNGPLVPIFANGKARILTFDSLAPDPLRTSFADLLEWLAAKDPRAIGGWRELSAEEYTRSFAVAQSAGHAVIREIHDALQIAFANGETAEQFTARILPLMQRRGWLSTGGQAPQRLQLIYDTNLRVARSAGRWGRYWKARSVFPYLRGVTARDERVRHPPRSMSDHRAFDGLILPIEHEFWKSYFVPLGFRCRCSVIQMTRSQLARHPGGVTSEGELEEIIDRLGPPVFSAPGSFDAQLEAIVGNGNDDALPGAPDLTPVGASSRGSSLMTAQLLDEGLNELVDVLNRIFGQAA